VALAERDLDDPVGAVMTTRPITLEPTAPAYRAALLMARHRFAHVCVAERGGPLLGVISERDLFSLQRVGLVGLSRAIDEADDVSALAALETDVRRFIGQMLARGAAVEQLTQLIATLNDAMTRRVIRLVLSDTGRPSVDFTWLAFGSEGRREQTLKTDQDNGILFRTPEGRTADDVRDELLPVARRINEALAEVGFPLCPGNIMAGNPECCLSLEEWQARFARWIDQGTPEHLLNATVFFDFRALDGDEAPVAALRADLRERARHNSRFRRQMAENALRNRPPLGLLRDFKVSSGGEHPHTLDLKVQGLTPFTDAARIVALAHGIDETGTMERLRAAATAGVVRDEDVAAWSEAYHFIQLLRMRTHRRQAEAGEPLDNRIDPDSLNELDRRILKEAFRQARKLQARLAVEYQL
jgi:CBS domain-containing protein